jgi:hypothetical protein
MYDRSFSPPSPNPPHAPSPLHDKSSSLPLPLPRTHHTLPAFAIADAGAQKKKTAAGGGAAGGVADKPPAFNGVYLRVCVGGGGLIVRVAVDVCEGGREESVCFTIHTYDGTR